MQERDLLVYVAAKNYTTYLMHLEYDLRTVLAYTELHCDLHKNCIDRLSKICIQ